MEKKINIIGLLINSLLLIWGFIIVLTYKTTNDIVLLARSSKTIELIISFIAFSGMFAGPIILIINFIKNQKNNVIPFMISILISICTVLLFIIKFDISGFRIFLIPVIYFVVYGIITFSKFIRSKKTTPNSK